MKIHIVQKGDTLWKIAKKYGVDFEELKKMNAQLSNPDMIMPGMKIKVPAGGTAVKKEHHHHAGHKEHPHHHPAGHKEVPKEHHVPKKVPKEIKKEVIIKEKPHTIYQPVMPQPLPEIDISNYYMMNMNQMQAQVQQQPPPPKEVEYVHEESPEMEMMPVQGVSMQPMYPNFCCPPPVMPVCGCDPCYPHPMMQPMHGMMGYPQQMPMGYMPMHGHMPMHHGHMPMYGQMPLVMPAAEYGGMPHHPQHWGDESSSSSMEMMHHHHHHQGHHGHHSHMSNEHMNPGWGENMDDPPMTPMMPMQGWSPEQGGGFPMMPAYPQGMQPMQPMMQPMQPMQPMGAPYGAFPGQPEAGGAFPMMPRNDEGEDE